MSLRTNNPTLGQHIQCLAKKGWLTVDVTHIGEPDSYLLSPCCEHGYRAMYTPRPKLDFFKASNNITEESLQNRRNAARLLNIGTDDIVSQEQRELLNQLADFDTVRLTSNFTWLDSAGADQPGFFTERQVNDLSGSWVLVAGASLDDTGFPTDAKAKWWATSQGNAATLEEELIQIPDAPTNRSQRSYYGDRGAYFDGLPTVSTFRRWVSGVEGSVKGALDIDPSGSVLGEESLLPNPFMGNESSDPYRGFRPEEIYWVLYGERSFEGIVICNDSQGNFSALHRTHGSGANWSGSTLIDPLALNLITPNATAEGGYKAKVIFYGGDVIGASGTSVVDSSGNITGCTMDDPGATVITNTENSSVEAPKVTIDMPLHYQGFDAKAVVSTDPQEIKSVLGDQLFRSKNAILAELCDGYADPIAQTFMVSKDIHPDGVFVPSIDLCFATKPNYGIYESVVVEIRPTVNGHPDSEKIIAKKTLLPHKVNVASGRSQNDTSLNPWDDPIALYDGTTRSNYYPSFSDIDSYTRVEFDFPVYLSPAEYAIVIHSNDSNYRCWISDISERAVNSNESLADYGTTDYPDLQTTSNIQQYGGVFFRSSNGRTWQANHNQDLMFRINKCDFGGSVASPKTATVTLGGSKVSESFKYDRIDLKVESIFNPNPNSTEVNATLKTRKEADSAVSTLSGISGNLIRQRTDNKIRDLSERMGYTASLPAKNSDIQIDYTLTTRNPDVSPIIDTRNIYAIPYTNQINSGEITLDSIKILSKGSGYVAGSDRFTITGGGSTSDSVVEVAAVDGSGGITSLSIVDARSGFYKFQNSNGTDKITVTHTTISGGSPTGATFQVLSEEGFDGGNSRMRYVTKKIDLAPGMEARALKVFLSAKEPFGSNIYVYYKVRSREDSEIMGLKKWKLMERTSPDQDFFSPSVSPIAGSLGDSVIEYEFNTDPIISYVDGDNNTHDTFGSFAIKIVGQASNPAQPPVISDLRAVAVY